MGSTSARGFWGGAGIALIDQGWLSLVNFVIGLAFLRLASKPEYGIFLQLFAAQQLSIALQTALACSPLLALGPKRDSAGLTALGVHMFWLQAVVALVFALLSLAAIHGLAYALQADSFNASVAWPFAAAVVATWSQEYLRAYLFARLQVSRVFIADLVFGGTLLGAVALAAYRGSVDSAYIFWAFAMSGAASSLTALYLGRLNPLLPVEGVRENLRQAWECSRWALPGAGAHWGANQTYVYIAAALAGPAAAANLGAARLLLRPVGMSFRAWSSVFRPRASRWLAQGEWQLADRVARWSSAALVAMLVVYLIVLLLSYDLLVAYVLSEKYGGLEYLLVGWCLYFIVNAVQMTGTGCMLAAVAFKQLFHYSLVSLTAAVPAMFVLTGLFGSQGTIGGLVVGQMVLASLIWWRGWLPMLRAAPRSQIEDDMSVGS